MLEDDVVAATKRIVTSTLDSRSYSGNKEKRGQDDQDRRGKRDSNDSSCTDCHNETDFSGGRAVKNKTRENYVEQTRFTVLPSQLLPIIQSLKGFEWPSP